MLDFPFLSGQSVEELQLHHPTRCGAAEVGTWGSERIISLLLCAPEGVLATGQGLPSFPEPGPFVLQRTLWDEGTRDKGCSGVPAA